MIYNEEHYDYCDLLIKPKLTSVKSRSDVALSVKYDFSNTRNCRNWRGIPILSANMTSSGNFEIARKMLEHEMGAVLHKHYRLDEYVSFFESLNEDERDRIFISVGWSYTDFLRYLEISGRLKYYPNICFDIANGYIEGYREFINECVSKIPEGPIIMAGNVCDGIGANSLRSVDIVKVGIGPGGLCKTRTVAGVGIPQASAVMMTLKSTYKAICADGGIREIADFSKAFGLGAQFIMIGSLLSGYEESGGETFVENNITYKKAYGMSSDTAMATLSEKKDYRSSEGRTVAIPVKPKGALDYFLNEVKGGLRSACTYTDSKSLADFINKEIDFVVVRRPINTLFEKETIGN